MNMIAMLSMGFEYEEKTFYALIRVKEKNRNREYHLTIMNGDLEKLLYGCHVFTEQNGELKASVKPVTEETLRLQASVLEFLRSYLASNSPIIGTDQLYDTARTN